MSQQLPDLPDLLPGFAARLEERAEALAAAQHDDAPAQAAPRPTRRRRWRMLGGAGLLAFVAVSGTYAAGLWHPRLGSNPNDAPAASAQPVAPELLDRLAVLRRPQNAADRGTAATLALRSPATSGSAVQTAGVRTIALAGGVTAVLVPLIERDSGVQQLCLTVLLGGPTGPARACATAGDVAGGRLLLAFEGPTSQATEADLAARRRAAQGGKPDAGGGLAEGPSTQTPNRVVGVAPDQIRAVWIGGDHRAPVDRNLFDAVVPELPSELRARWDD